MFLLKKDNKNPVSKKIAIIKYSPLIEKTNNWIRAAKKNKYKIIRLFNKFRKSNILFIQ
jgi:hypothetical protein